MNIHEYQAKALLAKYAVPLLKGGVAYTKDEAMDVARKLGGPVTVVKAQIHAGGRGKGRFKNDPDGKGGVRVSKSVEEVGENAAAMLGHDLVTKQTGPAGKTVKRLSIEDGCDIKRELSLSMLVDRAIGPGAGDIVALDAKMNFDDNGLERHKGLEDLRDVDEEDPAETEAAKYALNYVKLEGQIGCMVNGAGLAMATMDIIKLYGAEPANFLDVGGGATKERVTAAFKIILKDPNVEGILVNIFGGIMRCDVIAEGVVAAAREVNLHVPLVVRLEGTNVELGKKILKESGLKITSAENLADAAEKIVTAVKEAN